MREIWDRIRALSHEDRQPPGVLFHDTESYWNMAKEYRQEYVNIKYAVANVLQPKRICEIGVYSGISAMSFLAAYSIADYVGIDNLSAEKDRGEDGMTADTETEMHALGYKCMLHFIDSQDIHALPDPPYDLVHVDGCYTRLGTCNDVILAWKAINDGWILVDNAHDARVTAGVFDAMNLFNHQVLEWTYFDRSVGDILIRRRPGP
jgi:predicted O-methyltransferase YrrM